MSTIAYANDGSTAAPRLRVYLNMGTLNDLPAWSAAPRGEPEQILHAIKAAGFEGVQGGDRALCAKLGLGYAGGGRINSPADAATVAKANKDAGAEAATVHVGWGLEDDVEVDRLVDATINASVKHRLPLFIETHRATITQDLWRTVEITKRFAGVRFNADYSHYYTGLEMPYGGMDMKLAFMASIFDRTGFMHGRIGNSGSMQVGFTQHPDGSWPVFVEHFRAMWTAAMLGFLRHAGPGDYLVFAPELLQPAINYARTFPGADGQLREESDRWEQALLYAQIARACFADAQRQRQGSVTA